MTVVAVLVVLPLAVAVGLSLTRQQTYVATPPSSQRAVASAGGAAAALQQLETAVQNRDAIAAEAVAGPGAADLLAGVADNAGALEVEDFDLRYVDETSAVTAAGEWTAAVEVSWRFAVFDADPVRVELDVGFAQVSGEVSITGLGGGTRRSPLWLSGRIEVRRSPQTLVLVAGPPEQADLIARQARRAVPAVRAVVGPWPGGLVVEVPATAAGLDAIVAAEPGTYANIAAVSTTVDGNVTPTAPTHVLINPELYGRLGATGQQVVMTHEATHIATGAPLIAGMPTWLVEGFADYVALRDTDLPISTTAAQILERVRTFGVPRQLPRTEEFDPGATHLGASYEAAWLVCIAVTELASESDLVALYDAVRDGVPLDAALTRTVGVQEQGLTRAWARLLERLADESGVVG
jgi:hypothetical protein